MLDILIRIEYSKPAENEKKVMKKINSYFILNIIFTGNLRTCKRDEIIIKYELIKVSPGILLQGWDLKQTITEAYLKNCNSKRKFLKNIFLNSHKFAKYSKNNIRI